jgi:phenylpropionate dioxygenase-like ring-hydroxylating dioxygenase large terminal subunit
MLVSQMTFLRDHWHPVAVAADVTPDAAPRAVRLFGEDFVLWCTAPGEYALSEPYCPHRSAHLAGGWVDAGRIACPYHGWQFDGAGRCTSIPQMDEGLPAPTRARLRTFPAQAHYGVVWVCVGDAPVSPRPPVWVEGETEPTWRFEVEFFEEWQVAAPRIIDNNLDQSHVAFVHRSTFGDPRDARLPPTELVPTEHGFANRLVSEQPGVSVQNGQTTDESVRVRRTSEVELLAPLTSRTRLWYGGAQPDYCFFGAATPIDDSRSIYMRLTGLAGTEAEQPWDTFHAFGTRVKEEDRIILESTADDFPVDITSEVHLRCDRPTLEYRKYLMARLRPTPVALPRSA